MSLLLVLGLIVMDAIESFVSVDHMRRNDPTRILQVRCDPRHDLEKPTIPVPSTAGLFAVSSFIARSAVLWIRNRETCFLQDPSNIPL